MNARPLPLPLLALIATVAGHARAAAAESAPAPPDAAAIAAAPAPARADLQAAAAAVTAGDAQAAVGRLRAARADAALPADLLRSVDGLQDALTERLAQENLSQAQDQERAGKWAYAQRFLLIALAARMRAADELNALWSRPEAEAALGASARTQAEAGLASGHGPDALRWRLSCDRAQESLATAAAIDDMVALEADAGARDADLAVLLRAALDATNRPPFPVDATVAARLVGAASAVFGADDPQVAALRDWSERTHFNAGMAALGTHQFELGVAFDLGLMRLRARTASAAAPATTSGGFAPATATDQTSTTATGERLEVRLLRATSPPGSGPLLPVFGAGITASAFQATVHAPISDAGVGGANLTGLTYRGAYGAQGVGAEAIGGVRLRPPGPSTLSIAVLGVLGAEAVRTSLGTRPDAAGGSAAASTIHGSGLGVHASLEADLVVRPYVAWQAELGLGLGWERLPGAGGAGPATFINAAGTAITAGSESTGVSGVSAYGVWLRLGACHCW